MGDLEQNPNGYVCLSFDFDGPSLWIQRGMTTPTSVSRGEFGAVAVPRLLRLLGARDIPCTFFVPGHTIETYPAAHGFAVSDHGAAYDADAAQRHWDAMESFFGAKLG